MKSVMCRKKQTETAKAETPRNYFISCGVWQKPWFESQISAPLSSCDAVFKFKIDLASFFYHTQDENVSGGWKIHTQSFVQSSLSLSGATAKGGEELLLNGTQGIKQRKDQISRENKS